MEKAMPMVQPSHKQYPHLIADIERGDLKIPQFQREFVWDIAKCAKLLDSILKGYPIGSFILWRTRESLRSVRGLGRNDFPTRVGESVSYVLDGQQRLTSLYCCLKGLTIRRADGKDSDYSDMYIDLGADEDDQVVVTRVDVEGLVGPTIKIVDILTEDFNLLLSYPEAQRNKIRDYRLKITSYEFPVVEVSDATLDVATEIFTRINLGGKTLSVFEIMVARTYSEEKDFDLAHRCHQLRQSLQAINYDTISETTFLQVVSAILTDDITAKRILQLPKDDFIAVWDRAVDAIERTCEYFWSYYRIPVSQLLPYDALVIPFSVFFFNHNDKPLGKTQADLEDYFWKTSLTGRYSSSLESKMNQDLKKIREILADGSPKYEWAVRLDPDFLLSNGYFNASRSFVKAVLCIYAHHQPKSFIDNSIVNISNDWLKQANSKNYHHFFPKKSSACKEKDWAIVNNVFNITIVDDFLNKRIIKARNPSDYIQNYPNPQLADALESHLIGDLATFGILSDSLEQFVLERARRVSEFLGRRVQITPGDVSPVFDDDGKYEDDVLAEEDDGETA